MSEDLISREKAYEVLSDYYHHTTELQHKVLRVALDMVPSATQTNAPNTLNALDCVSRQAAIEVIEKMMEVYWDRKVVLARAWEQIKDLPSANLQPTCNKLATNLQPTCTTDCISRQSVLDAIDEIESEVADGDGFQYEKWRQYFCDLPSAEPEPKKGKWTEKEVIHAEEAKTIITEWQSCKCSVCGRYHTQPYMYFFAEPHFCSWCGAEMEKGEADV